ncbi:hypothetical protein O3G_MSEX004941 [Manduca sexta]|uniref:Uncharacterized protein n=1 Tax=Manduca sexta TaxID=7130 RepID=A0A921YYF4_MANSE|nr:hypothetical protein O3G_MSEX004941 [Manduca sexta]
MDKLKIFVLVIAFTLITMSEGVPESDETEMKPTKPVPANSPKLEHPEGHVIKNEKKPEQNTATVQEAINVLLGVPVQY